MRLLWLPDVLRAAGLTVHEVSGWRTRGADSFDPKGLICHATAGSSTSTDAGEIRVLLHGSATAPPPIAQLYLGRNGHWHVVASGRCNHALKGWAGPLKGLGNTNLIGVEAANDNKGEPWPAVQVDSYQRGVAAICRRMGWSADRVAGHKEHQPWPSPPGQTSTKSDPHGIDMDKFRARVAALLAGDDMGLSTEQDNKLHGLHTGFFKGGSSCGTTVPPEYRVDPGSRGNAIVDKLNYIQAKLDELERQAAPVELDYDRLADALLRRVLTAGQG